MSDAVDKQEVAEAGEHIYLSQNAPSFKLVGTVRIQFKDGIYRTSNPKEAAKLDDLIKTTPAISAVVRKVDKAAAKAAADIAMARIKRNPMAVRGAFSASDMRQAAHGALDDRDTALKAQGLDPATLAEQSEEIKSGDFALTHREAPKSTPRDGFIPQEAPQKPITTPEVSPAAAELPVQVGEPVTLAAKPKLSLGAKK